MKIGALQKTTLLDFPANISAIVFTQACNFTCPYCHNSSLVLQENENIESQEIIDFLAKRKNLLDGVVITGGEPCIQEDLVEFCQSIKKLGYLIKLDTNGSKPKVLYQLLELNLLDYIAMDIKADPKNYPQVISSVNLEDKILQSISLIQKSTKAYEFRVPCVDPFINLESMQAILEVIKASPYLFLQKVGLKNILQPDFFEQKGRVLLDYEIEKLRLLAINYVKNCIVR